MTPREILKNIIAIKPCNLFLEYIVERVQDVNYRGIHISQHNRYDLERLTHILNGIYEVVENRQFRVPLGDDEGVQESGCDEYYRIIKAVNRRAGIGTINSLKKNFFVDFERMGLLYRFNKKGESIGNSKRSHVYYAQLTNAAISLITSSSIVERHKIFTDSLDKLFANELTYLAETLYYSNYKNDPIGIWEFMLILSDDRPKFRNEKIKLIDSCRELKLWQQKKAIDLIKQYCNPKNFRGNKTTQRDFGNWKNETQQIFTLLKNTVYFDITKSSLRLNTGTYGIFSETQIKRRGLGAKHEYFVQHKIKKKIPTFELDHIVSFSSAKNKVEFGLIDNWRNLLYLRNDKHEQKTKYRDRNVVLTATEKEIHLYDFDRKSRISARNGASVVYAGKLADNMQKYNREILKAIFEYTED
jgi:hypothetical protein